MNRLQIAPGTPVSVSVAQFFGVALTISFTASQGDLVKGFEHLVNGYDENVKKQNQFAKRGKYVAAGVFQSLVGILMTTDLFILLMQSTSVIGMCLNFAALHFVQEIDDVAFMFASMGLLSQSIQLECLSVGDIMIAAKVRQRTWRFRRILMWFLLIGLYSAYFVISYQQWSGRFRYDLLSNVIEKADSLYLLTRNCSPEKMHHNLCAIRRCLSQVRFEDHSFLLVAINPLSYPLSWCYMIIQ